jgi:hypothetical protein
VRKHTGEESEGMLGRDATMMHSRNVNVLCVISGFRRDIYEICALLEYYAALSRVKKSKTLEDGPIGGSEMSVQNHHSTLRNNAEERRSHINLLFYMLN